MVMKRKGCDPPVHASPLLNNLYVFELVFLECGTCLTLVDNLFFLTNDFKVRYIIKVVVLVVIVISAAHAVSEVG